MEFSPDGVRRAEQRGGQGGQIWGPWGERAGGSSVCLDLVSGIRDWDLAQVVERLSILKAAGKHGRVNHSAFFALLIFL